MKYFLSFVLIMLIIAQPLQAQIELDSNGRASVGSEPPENHTTLFVKDTGNYIGIETRSENTGSKRYGMIARASSGSSNNYGVWAKASGGGAANYAILGFVSDTTANQYAGYFVGDTYSTGAYEGSDVKLKENVSDLDGTTVLGKLMQLRPRSYTYKQTGDYESMNLSESQQYGLLAQEVEQIFPEFIKDHVHPALIDENGKETNEPVSFKGMN